MVLNYGKARQPASVESHRLVNLMKEQGVRISKMGSNGNILKMRPPICFSRDNADLLLENLNRAFTRI